MAGRIRVEGEALDEASRALGRAAESLGRAADFPVAADYGSDAVAGAAQELRSTLHRTAGSTEGRSADLSRAAAQTHAELAAWDERSAAVVSDGSAR